MKIFQYLILFFIFFPTVLFAQSTIPTAVLNKIDSAVEANNIKEVTEQLNESSNKTWNQDLESYVLRKARLLVVQNDLLKAKNLCLAVIDSNLDNLEAVNLYQSVSAAIQKQEVEDKFLAEAEAVDAFKKQASEAKAKQDAEKKYATITNTSSGRKVYLDQNINAHYSTTTWDLMLGMVDFNAIISDENTSILYGLALSSSVFYHGEVFTIGADINGDAHILSLYGEPAVNWSASGVLSFAMTNISKFFFMRLGASYISSNTGNKDLEENFVTPLVGLGLQNIKIGESGTYNISVDWLAGHLYTNLMDLALKAQTSYAFSLAKMQDFDIFIRFAASDTLTFVKSGYTNDARLSLAFGVGNYD